MTETLEPQGWQVRMGPPAYGRSAPLPIRSHPWIRNTVVALATAAGIPTAAPLLGIDGFVVPAATTAAVLAAGVLAAEGYRRKVRADDIDRCTEQLCGVLGVPPTRAVMVPQRWHSGESRLNPGRPGRVLIRYTDAGVKLDPDWLTRVTDVMSGQPWGRYQLHHHDPRRCELDYRIDDSPIAAPDSEEVARAKRLILKILGPTAVVVDSAVDEAGQVTMIQARHDDGARFAPSGYRDRVERTISALLPGRWRARWNLLTDEVVFELRPIFPERIWNTPIPDPDEPYDKVAIAFGQDEDGNKATWRPAIDPHVIFVGSTGTGKTAAVHTVVTNVAARGWQVWVVDGKGTEFLEFAEWPNIQIVASRIEHQIAVIHRAWMEMEARYQAIQNGASEDDFIPLVVTIDEFADFKANLETWYAQHKIQGEPNQPPALMEIASLVRKGRSARVHVILSTQRADADFFSGRGRGDTRDSLRMRVSLGPLSPQGAMMMWYSPTTGTTIPRGIRGRATAVNEHGDAVEIQCFFTPDPRRTPEGAEGYDHLQRLRPAKTVHQRLVILPPEVEEEDEDEDDEAEYERGAGRKRRGRRKRKRPPRSVYLETATAPWGWAHMHQRHDPVRLRKQQIRLRPKNAQPYTLLGLADCVRPSNGAHPAPEKILIDAAAAAAPTNGRAHTNGHHLLHLVNDELDDTNDADDIDDTATGGWSAGQPDDDPWIGFSEPYSLAPTHVMPGDLICIDEDTDTWGVVDGEPGPDLLSDNDTQIAITCRTDTDGEEMIIVPDDGEIVVRRPVDHTD